MKYSKSITIVLIGIGIIIPIASSAQLNNKPFSFNTPTGGVGMSLGGQQAIINDKLFNIRPNNMIRSLDGSVLSVVKGPGNSALVFSQGGEILPAFKGSSWKGNDYDLSIGVFNSYFSPNKSGNSTVTNVFLNSSSTISTWTSRTASGGVPVSYSPGSSVDAWTGLTYP